MKDPSPRDAIPSRHPLLATTGWIDHRSNPNSHSCSIPDQTHLLELECGHRLALNSGTVRESLRKSLANVSAKLEGQFTPRGAPGEAVGCSDDRIVSDSG